MIKTKLGNLRVTCEGCNTREYTAFLNVTVPVVCDTCHKPTRRASFTDANPNETAAEIMARIEHRR